MRPLQTCKFFGAYRACSGIRNAVTLVHSTTGCQWGSIVLGTTSHLPDIRQGCSVIYEREAIFGGERSLEEALAQANSLYDAPLIMVINGCVPAITGDDVQAVTQQFSGSKQVIVVDAPGFAGDMPGGYDDALLALAELMQPPTQQCPDSINLIGVCRDDPKLQADLQEIEAMLGDISINAVITSCRYAEFLNAPCAALNVVCGMGEPLARFMQERFQIPYICVEYPYGIEGSTRFVTAIAAEFGKDLSAHIADHEQAVTERLKQIYLYVHELRGLPISVIGDPCRTRPLARCLEEELLLNVDVIDDTTISNDRFEVEEQIRQTDPVVLFGSSFERELAVDLDIPLLRVSYPVFDQVYVADRPYAGFQGTIHLLEDLINACMGHNYKRKGLLG
jgi:nitrogenase molybdenum-iron protein beta chain